jgi:hypothetical protein
LKNTHPLRYTLILRHCSVPEKYASFLRISRALHLDVFEQPAKIAFSKTC